MSHMYIQVDLFYNFRNFIENLYEVFSKTALFNKSCLQKLEINNFEILMDNINNK